MMNNDKFCTQGGVFMTDNARQTLSEMCIIYTNKIKTGTPPNQAKYFNRNNVNIELSYHELLTLGAIKTMDLGGNFALTPYGISMNDTLNKQDQQRAEERRKYAEQQAQTRKDTKKQRRHEWAIAVVSACGSSVLTLCIEHFSKIVDFFISLFH